jgi:hypothetical protein
MEDEPFKERHSLETNLPMRRAFTGDDITILALFAEATNGFPADIAAECIKALSCAAACKIARGILARDWNDPEVREYLEWGNSLKARNVKV